MKLKTVLSLISKINYAMGILCFALLIGSVLLLRNPKLSDVQRIETRRNIPVSTFGTLFGFGFGYFFGKLQIIENESI